MQTTRLHRLKLFARHHKKTVSQVVEEAVEQVMAKPATTKPDRYAELLKLKGIGKSDPNLKNLSVDEILYGEHGTWRGSER